MCGIAGFWHREGTPADSRAVERMLDRIEHRGPDDRGTWIDESIALGHQRLSILDLSERGHQPFISADGKGIITYNGEVYNYLHLRAQLEQEGVRFKSTTDTEVVLYALHLWGPKIAIPRFNGMFSFAYLDRRCNTLVLARDRLGIKPLYVTKSARSIIFASEIKAILAHPSVTCVPDRHALAIHALLYRLDGDMTPFEGIIAVRPGSYWEVRVSDIIKVDYFDVLEDLDVDRLVKGVGRSPQQMAADFHQAISESVRLHLASDAPLATMCSGGLDSSLITALVKRYRSDVVGYVADVKTTVSEGEKANQVGRHLSIPIRQVDVDEEMLLRLWPEATWFGDQPNTHGNDMPMLAVARACRNDGVKVILTGEGSDELFGGYDWQFEAFQHWRYWQRHPFSRLNLNNKWLRRLASFVPHRFYVEAPKSEDPFFRFLGRKENHGGLRLLFPFDPDRQLRGAELFKRLEAIGPTDMRAFLARGLDDLYGHLEGLLRRNDRMAMAASVETRVPFIENRLIQMGIHAPFRVKYHQGHGKWLVKTVGKKYLPRDIVYAKKLGFPVPRDYACHALPLLEDGLVPDIFRWSSRTTQTLVEYLRCDPNSLWFILSIEIWARLFLRGESRHELGDRLVRNARVAVASQGT